MALVHQKFFEIGDLVPGIFVWNGAAVRQRGDWTSPPLRACTIACWYRSLFLLHGKKKKNGPNPPAHVMYACAPITQSIPSNLAPPERG